MRRVITPWCGYDVIEESGRFFPVKLDGDGFRRLISTRTGRALSYTQYSRAAGVTVWHSHSGQYWSKDEQVPTLGEKEARQ